MSWRQVLSRLGSLFGSRAADDLGEEIRAHIEMEGQSNRESGMPPEEAYYAARRRFGNVALAEETSREMWGWHTGEALVQDLRYAARQLRRNPGFTVVVVLALALGIGVDTAVFTAYEAMVGRSVDARNPREIVNIALVHPPASGNFLFSYPDYQAYRDSLHSFRGLIAFKPERLRVSDAGLRPSGETSSRWFLGLPSLPGANAEFASVFAVSENYFQVLGVEVARGRGFESMSVPELLASPAVLISENYWERRFARDPAAVGRTLRLNRVAVTIAGIAPRDFVGTSVSAPDFWLPISLEPLVHVDENWLRDRENLQFRIYGRLAPGAGIVRAQAEVNVLADRLRSQHAARSEAAGPVTALVWPGSPFPLPLKMFRGLILSILLIMSAAGMVLVIACANVASLQLARGRSRQTELQTRLSLGASRKRLIRQLLTESALSGLIAGALALPFTWGLLRAAVALATERLGSDASLVFDVAPNPALFAFVSAVSLAAGILFGIVPAIEASRSALSSNLRGGTSPVRTRRLQDLLLTAQVGLSLVLLIAASMLIRSSMKALNMETGYESRRVVDVSLQFPEGLEYGADRKTALVQKLRTRLATLPGVVAITSARAPDESSFRTVALTVDRATSSARRAQSVVHYAYIQADYFQTLGIPLLAGRSFREHAGVPEHSVILSESAAKELWPRENAVGHNVRLGPVDERLHNERELIADGPAWQVIGVVRDTRGVEFDGSDSRRVYLPLTDKDLPGQPILIRTHADPSSVIRAINPLVSSIDPDLTVTVSTLDELLRYSAPFIGSRLAGAVASAVGLIGLILALMGIYGTVNYVVVLRTREVGIRMAIGARSRDVLRLILGESLRPLLAGLLVGMVLALGASYALRGLLYGVRPVDGISFTGVSLLFLAIGAFAAYPSSRRASRVDPHVALRHE